ncbi:MAG: SPOR domain-containing protein [Treponema sp.]|jgi:DedD protein|nr:SPOR domain-containing protein [Treponema sp.]
MEKKKLLLVAVSVGVFLVIVVSAAILIFSPGSPQAGEDFRFAAPVSSATTDPTELLNAEEVKGLQDPAVYSPIQKNEIYINGDPDSKVVLDRIDNAVNTKTIISVPKPAAPAVPAAPVKTAAAVSRTETPRPAQSAPAPRPAASVAPPKKVYDEFWVQAGSFSARDRADRVKETLGGKGVSAIVTNQDINGQTYYRVRVGPYTSQNEADYWLAMIKSIDGFEGSQVWESQSKR